MAEAAVVAIGKLASRFDAERAACIGVLVSLVNATTDLTVFTTVMQVLHKFDLRTSSDAPQVLKFQCYSYWFMLRMLVNVGSTPPRHQNWHT